MSDLGTLDKHYIDCPFCFQPINAAKIFQPENWVCPVCKKADPDWNIMLNCANCGYGHRIFECPHCKEDFDTMREMFDYSPHYLDYIRVEKYEGPQAKYRLGDLKIVFSHKLDEDFKRNLLDLFSDVSFKFPGHSGQIRTVQIYGMEEDESIKNKLWLSAYLYDRDEAKPNTDVGQIVLYFTKEDGVQIHSVIDVSRNFLANNEKQKGKSSQPEIIDESESLCIEKIHQLFGFVQAHELQTENEISEGCRLADDCLKLCLNVLSDTFGSNREPSERFWDAISDLGECVVSLSLIDKDMPWYGTELSDIQEKSKNYLTRYISNTYYNSGVALSKSGEFELARQRYKTAAKFNPEPILAVPLHYNWAKSIAAEIESLDKGQKKSVDKACGNIAHYCEMIAHFDEVVRQYPLLTNDDKDFFRAAYDESKEMVQNVLNMETGIIRRSKADPSQLMLVSHEDGRELTPLKTTWTEYDLTDVQQDSDVAGELTQKVKISSPAGSQSAEPELEGHGQVNEETAAVAGSKGANKAIIGVITAVLLLVAGFVVFQNNGAKRGHDTALQLNKASQIHLETVPVQKTGYTTIRVNLRTAPGKENSSIGVLAKNTAAFLIGSKRAKNGEAWYQLKIAEGPLKGKTGYLHNKYFDVEK